MKPKSRRIRKHDVPSSVGEVLQGLFASELLKPSEVVWLVSAWVSDAAVIDNATGAFSSLDPGWPRAPIRLLRVITTLAKRGTSVHVATNLVAHNDEFCRRLEQLSDEGLPVQAHRQRQLHDKGLLSSRFFLFGSMNFTHNGIHAEEQSEYVELIVDPSRLAEEHLHFRQRWGGTLP